MFQRCAAMQLVAFEVTNRRSFSSTAFELTNRRRSFSFRGGSVCPTCLRRLTWRSYIQRVRLVRRNFNDRAADTDEFFVQAEQKCFGRVVQVRNLWS